jgi:hypothetical protein
MLKHAYRDNFVTFFMDITIIAFPNVDRKAFAVLRGVTSLFAGDRDGCDGASVVLRGIFRQSSPTASDVQEMILRFQV